LEGHQSKISTLKITAVELSVDENAERILHSDFFASIFILLSSVWQRKWPCKWLKRLR
jgi:hypothetical protein